MTTIYVKPGDALDYKNASGADIAVNSVINNGAFVGVAAIAIANGVTGTQLVTGVFNLPKKAGTAAPVGTKLTWSVADGAFIVGAGVSGDVANCAVVVEVDAASADTSVRAFIDTGMGSAVA